MKPWDYFSASSIASSVLLCYITVSFSEVCFFICRPGLIVVVLVVACAVAAAVVVVVVVVGGGGAAAAAAVLVTLSAPPHGLATATLAAKISIICIV